MLVALPFVLLLLDYWPLERVRLPVLRESNGSGRTPMRCPQPSTARSAASLPRLLVEKVSFLVLSAVSRVITFRAQQSEGAVLDASNFPIGARIANALLSRQGHFDKALARYSAAARLRPEHLYFFNLANALMDAWKAAEAVPNYQ